MRLLRKSKSKCDWLPNIEYISSFYNIAKTIRGCTAIYNAATGSVAIIEESNLLNLTEEDRKILVENGIMVPKDTDEFLSYFSTIQMQPKKNINYFTIIPTTACNAKCFYCYEKGYPIQRITECTHSKILKYLKKNIGEQNEFVLDWYGGEPLLCVREIDRIVYGLEKSIDLTQKKWSSSITTNSTLFTEDLIHHAIDYWHLKEAHITIDGPEKDHNARKRVIFDGDSAFAKTRNTIIQLLEAGVYVNVRVHLDHNNENKFPELLHEISTFFDYDNFHLFPTFLFPPEFEMPNSYIADNEKEEFFKEIYKHIFKTNYKVTLIDSFPWPKNQSCFATKANTVVIGPDGNIHSCVQEFLNDTIAQHKKFSDYSKYCYECKECLFFPICLGGCIHNHDLDSTVRTPCVRNRYIVKPLLELLIDSWQQGTIKM